MKQNLIFLLYLKGCPIDIFISIQNDDLSETKDSLFEPLEVGYT